MKRMILSNEEPEIYDYIFCSKDETQDVITAAINSRDLAKNIVRCKSSNLWGYTYDIKDNTTNVGDLMIQFKDRNGGPGDIYLYYDVPVKIIQKLSSAPSKGHYFWQYIRDKFNYQKLTGDKKGKTAYAIS